MTTLQPRRAYKAVALGVVLISQTAIVPVPPEPTKIAGSVLIRNPYGGTARLIVSPEMLPIAELEIAKTAVPACDMEDLDPASAPHSSGRIWPGFVDKQVVFLTIGTPSSAISLRAFSKIEIYPDSERVNLQAAFNFSPPIYDSIEISVSQKEETNVVVRSVSCTFQQVGDFKALETEISKFYGTRLTWLVSSDSPAPYGGEGLTSRRLWALTPPNDHPWPKDMLIRLELTGDSSTSSSGLRYTFSFEGPTRFSGH